MRKDTIREKCCVEGCNTLRRNKGSYKGVTYYGKHCVKHHKINSKDPNPHTNFYYWKRIIPNSKCEVCGWDKAACDRHRIKPEIGYTRENVKILCPNCHRLVGVGLLVLN